MAQIQQLIQERFSLDIRFYTAFEILADNQLTKALYFQPYAPIIFIQEDAFIPLSKRGKLLYGIKIFGGLGQDENVLMKIKQMVDLFLGSAVFHQKKYETNLPDNVIPFRKAD